MSKKDKKTTMGRAKASFQTTRWTEIRQAKTNDHERRNVSLNNLMSRYWKPVYHNLLHKGISPEDAEDITQGFFFEIVFEGELIQNADQTQGRFRNFLLTALNRYVIDFYRRENAKKRIPEHGFVQLDVAELLNIPTVELELCPDQAYTYTWTTDLLDHVFEQIKENYHDTDNEISWQILIDTIIDPILNGVESPSLSELCKKYGFKTKKKASNMKAAVKRKFKTTLRLIMRQRVDNESQVEEEINDIIKILSKGSAA